MKNNLDRLKFSGFSKEKFNTNEALLKRIRAVKVLTEGLPEVGAIPHAFKDNTRFETRVSLSDETIGNQRSTRKRSMKTILKTLKQTE